jgi:light-regulated signal transduction histidine kinase (bacteriophytochrome)
VVIAREVIDELRRREPERTTPVHVASGLIVHADPRLATVVLDNLLSNAWKFTARHPAAEIWFGREGKTFHVRDTGAGFDMQYVDKLFTPFQRLHAVTEFEGVGVGLAIVARIVARHGGRIYADAAVNRGATFYFSWEA